MVDVIAIGAHPDDVEIAMGGTIAKMVRQGRTVGILDLTNGEPTPAGTPEIRAAEMKRAAEVLGVAWRLTLDMPNRALFDTVENRRKIAAVLREHRPNVIIAHHWDDSHPDHIQAHALSVAARFHAKFTKTDMPGEPYWVPRLYFFGLMHLQYAFKPAFIIPLDEADFQKKLQALRCYQSQAAVRAWLDKLQTYNAYFGTLINHPHAEPFASKTELALDSFESLL